MCTCKHNLPVVLSSIILLILCKLSKIIGSLAYNSLAALLACFNLFFAT